MNDFVQVVHKETSSESTISCAFQNQSDTSDKKCCVTHQLCDQQESQKFNKCNNDSPYNIQLKALSHSSQRYCYTVTASNDTYTVKVEGNFIAGTMNYSFCNFMPSKEFKSLQVFTTGEIIIQLL